MTRKEKIKTNWQQFKRLWCTYRSWRWQNMYLEIDRSENIKICKAMMNENYSQEIHTCRKAGRLWKLASVQIQSQKKKKKILSMLYSIYKCSLNLPVPVLPKIFCVSYHDTPGKPGINYLKVICCNYLTKQNRDFCHAAQKSWHLNNNTEIYIYTCTVSSSQYDTRIQPQIWTIRTGQTVDIHFCIDAPHKMHIRFIGMSICL